MNSMHGVARAKSYKTGAWRPTDTTAKSHARESKAQQTGQMQLHSSSGVSNRCELTRPLSFQGCSLTSRDGPTYCPCSSRALQHAIEQNSPKAFERQQRETSPRKLRCACSKAFHYSTDTATAESWVRQILRARLELAESTLHALAKTSIGGDSNSSPSKNETREYNQSCSPAVSVLHKVVVRV